VQVGKPIHVEKCEKPNLEQVMEVQQLYIEELTRFVNNFTLQYFVSNSLSPARIWNTYKDEFAKARTRELSIID
jgi:Diacylglycerol acyltransferase.